MQFILAPLENTHPALLGDLISVCKNFIKNGTPKQAKHSIKCLHMNLTESQVNIITQELCLKQPSNAIIFLAF